MPPVANAVDDLLQALEVGIDLLTLLDVARRVSDMMGDPLADQKVVAALREMLDRSVLRSPLETEHAFTDLKAFFERVDALHAQRLANTDTGKLQARQKVALPPVPAVISATRRRGRQLLQWILVVDAHRRLVEAEAPNGQVTANAREYDTLSAALATPEARRAAARETLEDLQQMLLQLQRES
ncbi:MAG: hypothetical protein ACYCW6_03545 [Candidatus Xenobia bacterium]